MLKTGKIQTKEKFIFKETFPKNRKKNIIEFIKNLLR